MTELSSTVLTALKLHNSWWFPAHEDYLLRALHADPRIDLHGRPAYQGYEQIAASQRCRQHRVAIDIGAHVGLWGYNLAHEFETVEAFEPVALHRICFTRNIPHEMSARVHMHGTALGIRADQIDMRVEKGNSGNTSVSGDAGTIFMRTLDSFDLSNVDLIKVDCAGYEENALRGGEALLRKWLPVVIVDQQRERTRRLDLKYRGAVRFLQSLGYGIDAEFNSDCILVHPDSAVVS